jgi:hypothetical protein
MSPDDEWASGRRLDKVEALCLALVLVPEVAPFVREMGIHDNAPNNTLGLIDNIEITGHLVLGRLLDGVVEPALRNLADNPEDAAPYDVLTRAAKVYEAWVTLGDWSVQDIAAASGLRDFKADLDPSVFDGWGPVSRRWIAGDMVGYYSPDARPSNERAWKALGPGNRLTAQMISERDVDS